MTHHLYIVTLLLSVGCGNKDEAGYGFGGGSYDSGESGGADDGASGGDDDDGTSPTPSVPATFEEVLADVLVPSCGFDACHGSGAGYLRIHDGQTEEEWLDMQSIVIADKALITPGNAAQSYLIMKMEGASTIEGDVMPPSGSIATDRIERVRSWIDALD